MELFVNEWPESQICIGCRHAVFIPEGYGSSAYGCKMNCEAQSECCKINRIEVSQEEWEDKFV